MTIRIQLKPDTIIHMNTCIATHSPEETLQLGYNLGINAVEGTVIALTGDLGSGKTAFTQGLARGIGILHDYVTSPSYTLINHYTGNGPDLFHVDLYRLSDSHETEDLGLGEVLHRKGVVVIEWAEKFGHHFWWEDLEIRIKIIGDRDREFFLTTHGQNGDKLISALLTDEEQLIKEET